jgi:chloramphenicol-sensitive protein RarD
LNKYYLAAIGAFLIWGLFSFALKPLSGYQSLDILFYRVFCAAAILFFYGHVLRHKKMRDNYRVFNQLPSSLKKQTITLTFIGGALLTANWFVFIYVTNQISIKSAAYAYMICPILTTVLGFLVLKEKLLKHQWWAVFISFTSVVILAVNYPKDVLYSMIVAVSYAFYLISQRKNVHIEKLPILTYQMLFASLILGFFYPTYASELPSQMSFYLLIVVIAVVFTIVPLLLNLFAIEGLSSATVGILLYINPIMNFIVAVLFFKEETSLWQIVSYGLVLISILVFNKHLFSKKGLTVVE